MKKLICLFTLLSILCCSTLIHAQNNDKLDPGFVLLDVILYRPVGLVVTALGAVSLIAVSPLIGLASIPEPHDAFTQTSDILFVAPATYTFIRPIGDRHFPFVAPLPLHHLVSTQKAPLQPKQTPTPTAPSQQSVPTEAKGL